MQSTEMLPKDTLADWSKKVDCISLKVSWMLQWVMQNWITNQMMIRL